MLLIGPISLQGVLIVQQMILMRIGVLDLRLFCPVIQIFCTSCQVKVLPCLRLWIRITPLLSPWSTMTKMESKLSISGRSVMKSIEQLVNGLVLVAPSVGIKEGFEGCLSILNC